MMKRSNSPQRQEQGFTLIEVLLTMAILSLVMLTATYAYNYITQNWQRNQQHYDTGMQQYYATSLVYRAVTDTQAKIVRSEPVNNQRVQAMNIGFYFLGRDEGFTAYTNTAVQDPSYPAVYRLFRERDDNGNWQLVYEESLLNNTLLSFADQQLPFNFRLVVASELRKLEFEYYAWPDFATRLAGYAETSENLSEPQWFTDFDGLTRMQHPLTIQIHLNDFLWPVQVTDITQELIMQSSPDDA